MGVANNVFNGMARCARGMGRDWWAWANLTLEPVGLGSCPAGATLSRPRLLGTSLLRLALVCHEHTDLLLNSDAKISFKILSTNCDFFELIQCTFCQKN